MSVLDKKFGNLLRKNKIRYLKMMQLLTVLLMISLTSTCVESYDVVIKHGSHSVVIIPGVINDTAKINLLQDLLFEHNTYELFANTMCTELLPYTPLHSAVEIVQQQLQGKGYYLFPQTCQFLYNKELMYSIEVPDTYPIAYPYMVICVPIHYLIFLATVLLISLAIYALVKSCVSYDTQQLMPQPSAPPEYTLVVDDTKQVV